MFMVRVGGQGKHYVNDSLHPIEVQTCVGAE